MAVASYTTRFQVADTVGGTYSTMGGVNDVSITIGRTLIDTSDMDGSSDYTKRIAALKDIPISVSGFYGADTAFLHLRDNFTSPTANDVFVKVLTGSGPDVGFQVQCMVESIDISASVDGAQEVSISLQSTGDLTLI